jgi:uncharacterized membrane protein
VKAALAILVFASPLALHLAIVTQSRTVMVAFLAVLAVGALAARMPAWMTALAAVAAIGSAWIDLRVIAQLALAGPALAFLAVAWLFGRTLLPGRTPLVETIARLERDGDFPTGLAGYTRRLTWAWAILLAGIPAVAAALALFATAAAQSLFVNFASYALLALLYFGEYAYRVWRYPQFPHKNPVTVAANLVRRAPELLRP